MKTIKRTLTAGIVVGMLLFTSCAKKGCTDGDAENFCSDCKKDDGSCTFKGQMVFWWQQSFMDSCRAYGIANIQVYFDNSLAGTLPVSAQYWTSAPACGATGALTITKELGKNKKGSYSEYEKYLDGTGAVFMSSSPSNQTLNANTCTSMEMTW